MVVPIYRLGDFTEYTITGVGFVPEGDVLRKVQGSQKTNRQARAAVLCSNARLQHDTVSDDGTHAVGPHGQLVRGASGRGRRHGLALWRRPGDAVPARGR